MKLNRFLFAALIWMQNIKFNFDYFFELYICSDLDNLNNQTNKVFLHYTEHSIHYKVCQTRAQSTKSNKREKTWEKINLNLKFYLDNLVLKMSLKLILCLSFAQLDSQTNKLLAVHALHCTVYTVQYVPYMQELSTSLV